MRYLIKRVIVIIIVMSFLITIPGLNQAFASNQEVKVDEELKDKDKLVEEDKVTEEVEEKISTLRERKNVIEEEIKEIYLLIEKIEDKDIREKYKKILNDFKKELNKDNSKIEEEDDKNQLIKDDKYKVVKKYEKNNLNSESTIKTEKELRDALENNIAEILIEGEIKLTKDLKINKNIILKGKDENSKLISDKSNDHIIFIENSSVTFKNITLDGNNKSGLIKVNGEQGLILENVILKNANAKISGVAVNTNGDLDIINSIIENNKSIGEGNKNFGGAIYSTGNKNVTISNSKFISNELRGGQGAALYIEGKLNILDDKKETLFENNKVEIIDKSEKSSKASGGAIYIKGEYNINNTKFIDNFASASGGAILLDKSKGSIKKSEFKNNKTFISGGALKILSGETNIVSSNFLENKVENPGGYFTLGAYGGAIKASGDNKSSKLDIKDTNFTKNSLDGAKSNGGASGAAIDISYIKDVFIEGGSYISNSVKKDAPEFESGGAISIEKKLGEVKIKSAEFKGNVAGTGGAIYSLYREEGSEGVTPNTWEYRDLTISENKAFAAGGGIQFVSGNQKIINSQITDNESLGNGGGIDYKFRDWRLSRDWFLEINNSKIKRNKASKNGGGIYIANGDLKILNKSKINNNKAQASGGGVYVLYDTNIEIDNSEFLANKSTNHAGALMIFNIKDLIINESLFEGNICKENGGAIYYSQTQNGFVGKGKIKDSTFDKNSALLGGGIYNNFTNLNIESSIFYENNATDKGGAIYGYYNPLVKINESIFKKNISKDSGGAIYTNLDDIKINKSKFKKNRSYYGSAITMDKNHNYNMGLLEIDNTKFNDNYSDRIGTIYIKTKDSKDYLDVNIDKNVEFFNNKIGEKRRFINGFSEDKYKGYKDDLTKNIKTTSSSLSDYPYEMKYKKEFQQKPFNNIDINILDYEYFISHNNPEGMKGYYDVEVFKGKDQGELKFEDKTVLEFKKLTETEKQKIKVTLKDYSLNRYDKLGEIVSNEEDAFKINSNDIDVNGIWYIEILDREPLEEKIDIKFNANGGIVNDREIDIIKIDKGSTVESQKATREGYKFLGWFKNLEDEKAFDFNKTLDKDLELFAKWEKTEEEIPSKPNKPKDKEEKEEDKEKDKDKEEDKAEVKKDDIVVGKISERLNRKDHMRYLEGYPDETIRANGDITREEVSAALFRLLDDDYRDVIRCRGEACPLYDVHDGRWSKKHINTMINGNIVKGSSDGKFYPDRAITRAELITMIDRLDDFKYTDKTKEDLKDIKGHWAEEAISSGIQKGWVIGFEDDTFRPDDELTRAEFTVVMNRILNRVPNKESIPDNVREYKDLDESDWYYYDFVEACNCHKYEKNKDGTMDWKGLIYSENEM